MPSKRSRDERRPETFPCPGFVRAVAALPIFIITACIPVKDHPGPPLHSAYGLRHGVTTPSVNGWKCLRARPSSWAEMNARER